ncbi:pentapeptide repeat-containing protein [Dyella kyungheensis]|uniref:pentapeptide repeat-containing protein n=1 Tax=Dyella kyungheensis TaxID=1242174 RepID=UPI003CEA96EF
MKFDIKHRWSGNVIFSCELTAELAGAEYALQLGFAVKKAIEAKANLYGANLYGATLSRADLSGANLSRANLYGADLYGANLSRANLSGANLYGATLSGANLSGANLRSVRADFYDVLAWAPAEVPALIDALKNGGVDGSTYQGACACLVGTIANVRGVEYSELEHDSSRPIEVFFASIREGDTPATNQFSAIATEWAEQWLANMRVAFNRADGAAKAP